MVTCSVCVAVTFYFKETLVAEGILLPIRSLIKHLSCSLLDSFYIFTVDGWGLTAACSVIVILGTLAHLASVGSSIVVYKDWIAIIAEGDSQTLARKSELNVGYNKLLSANFQLNPIFH